MKITPPVSPSLAAVIEQMGELATSPATPPRSASPTTARAPSPQTTADTTTRPALTPPTTQRAVDVRSAHGAMFDALRAVPAAGDDYKADAVQGLRERPSEAHALRVADDIAMLHNKPDHAKEVVTMIQALMGVTDDARRVELAARLIVLGEYSSSTEVMTAKRPLTDDERRDNISPINKRAAALMREILGDEDLAQMMEGKRGEGLTPYLHVCRDIAAMDAPRPYRVKDHPPEGRLSADAVTQALEDNNEKPGRNAAVTRQLLVKYLEHVANR